jgi:cell division protease FtsH
MVSIKIIKVLFWDILAVLSLKNYFSFFKNLQTSKSLLFLNSNTNKHPFSKKYYEDYLKRLNSKNVTIQNNNIIENYSYDEDTYYYFKNNSKYLPKYKIIINPSKNFNGLSGLGLDISNSDNFESDENNQDNDNDNEDEDESEYTRNRYRNYNDYSVKKVIKSKNFEVIKDYPIKFNDIGGYENVKEELNQCVDILSNYQKYAKFNVRIPKGLIFEGPPGNGKTLLAKGLAGESNCSFIPVSGAEFQEKYVGVGSSRMKELFDLAKKNIPCIIFIDEIDAVGRKRSGDGESSSNERDNTLNALLVELDGFKNNTGIFVVGATNRLDLLDLALIRPGRIDKKIYIGLPDASTRKSIISIHINGKPYDSSIKIDELVEITDGLSGAQIENLLNEAMLNALKMNRFIFNYTDFDLILNKMMAGWQPSEHKFTSNIIDHIAIHEMGHAIVGIFSKHHSKLSKVIINLSSPKSPGYTVFENIGTPIYIREALFEHLMILLSGRIAEEVFYGISVTTGALNDFEEALKLAERMVIYYGMGSNIIYPNSSEKYKEMIDTDVVHLINNAYSCAKIIIQNSKMLIYETSGLLKKEKILKAETIIDLINEKYPDLWDIRI